MKRELDVIYAIWEIVRAGQINQDDPINERLLRSFLRIHRGKHLSRNYSEGAQIPDEVFQNLGNIQFSLTNSGDFVSEILPKMIRFKNNFGFIADKDGYTIPVLNSEEFDTSKKNPFNKFHPKIKFIDDRMYLNIGLVQNCGDNNLSSLNFAVNSFIEEAQKDIVTLNLRSVLVNPDDAPGYDFTTSIYPFPDELIEDLINSVNAREFNFFLKTRSDEVTNSRDNSSNFNTREEV